MASPVPRCRQSPPAAGRSARAHKAAQTMRGRTYVGTGRSPRTTTRRLDQQRMQEGRCGAWKKRDALHPGPHAWTYLRLHLLDQSAKRLQALSDAKMVSVAFLNTGGKIKLW